MSKIKCPQCGDRDVSITLYTPPDRDVASCRKCGHTSLAEDFPEQSLFDRITASPEVLSPYLVFFSARDNGWCSMLTMGSYDTYKEAIAATVAKLKEVCDAENDCRPSNIYGRENL